MRFSRDKNEGAYIYIYIPYVVGIAGGRACLVPGIPYVAGRWWVGEIRACLQVTPVPSYDLLLLHSREREGERKNAHNTRDEKKTRK